MKCEKIELFVVRMKIGYRLKEPQPFVPFVECSGLKCYTRQKKINLPSHQTTTDTSVSEHTLARLTRNWCTQEVFSSIFHLLAAAAPAGRKTKICSTSLCRSAPVGSIQHQIHQAVK